MAAPLGCPSVIDSVHLQERQFAGAFPERTLWSTDLVQIWERLILGLIYTVMALLMSSGAGPVHP